jgi:hypothetical protein
LNLGANKFSVQPTYPLTGADSVTCRFIASQAGDSNYSPALDVERTLLIKKQATRVSYRTSSPTVAESGTFIYASGITTEGRLLGSLALPLMTSLTPTICTVGDVAIYDTVNGPRGTARAKSNGTCSIKIDHLAAEDRYGSTTTWTSVIAGLSTPVAGDNAAQSITFPAIADRNLGKSAKLLATTTSKLAIKYISLTPSICFVIEQLADGAAVQSSKAAGSDAYICTIQATQPGDDRYAAATPVQVSFNYLKAPMMLVHATAPSSIAGAAPVTFITNVLYVESSMNSGLRSLGHLLSVTAMTPAICRVDSNVLWDRTGGIVNRTTVTALANGSCSLSFYFPGTSERAAVTLVTTRNVTGILVPTSTFVELQSLQQVMPASGSTLSLKGLDAGRININAFVKTPDPALMGVDQKSLNTLTYITTQTPLVCVVERVTTNLGSSNSHTGAVIKPLKAGICNVLFTYPGETSMKRTASSTLWSATVTS